MAKEAKSKYAADDITDENLVPRLKARLGEFGVNLDKTKITFVPGHLTIVCEDGTVEEFAGKTSIELYDKVMDRCFDVNIIVLTK